jgi:hypothetical protein
LSLPWRALSHQKEPTVNRSAKEATVTLAHGPAI